MKPNLAAMSGAASPGDVAALSPAFAAFMLVLMIGLFLLLIATLLFQAILWAAPRIAMSLRYLVATHQERKRQQRRDWREGITRATLAEMEARESECLRAVLADSALCRFEGPCPDRDYYEAASVARSN